MGYLVILSGSAGADPEWAGVGFIVAPKLRSRVVGFCQLCNRIASIKLKCNGEKLSLICVYAPHNMKPMDEKWAFYDKLSDHYQQIAVNGPRLIFGDLNARLGQRRPGEQDVLGDYCFGREASRKVEVANRDLLMEFCWSHQMVVANTLLPSTDEQQVTYHEPRIEPMAIISPQGFSMLDLLLMPEGATDRLTSIFSDRAVTLASHHFPVVATIACREEESNFRSHKRKVLDWSSLRNQQYRSGFVREVQSLHLPTGAETGHWDDACQRIQSAAERLLPAMKRRPNKPWFSEGTLVLIDRKRDARTEGDWTAEKSVNKLVK